MLCGESDVMPHEVCAVTGSVALAWCKRDLLLAGVNHAQGPADPDFGASNGVLLVWEYKMFGVVVLHWTLVLTVALGCLSFE